MNKQTYVPDAVFAHFSDINAAILSKYNIKGVLTDLDDTLVAHNAPEPDEKLLGWLKNLKDAGYNVCIVSNNRKKRTTSFAEKVGIGFFYNSLKPFTHALLKALKVLNIKPDEAVFIGDQLFTDVKGAKKCGMKAFLVNPVGNKTTLFIKFKRIFEKKLKK